MLAINSEFPIAKFFQDVDSNIKIGRDIDESFADVIKKFPLSELNFLAISVSVQKRTGGNMSEIISNLSNIIRQRERLKSKIKAMSSEARASAMIIGSLPFIMSVVIWIVNPEYIATLWNDSRGNMLALAGMCSMGTGIMVIAKMVNFKI